METSKKPSPTPVVTNNLTKGGLTDVFYSNVSECLSVFTDRVNLTDKTALIVNGGSK
jgi:hypothetical protein